MMSVADAILRGRREGALLEQPSVARMAETLARRCRDTSRVRTTVASLDRFAALMENRDLEALLERARRKPRIATETLQAFALALGSYQKSQIAALAMAPKLWFTLNGVPVAWRPLAAGAPQAAHGRASIGDRLVLLALVGSGLHGAELRRLRLGDLGSLDTAGALVSDLDADPLAVRFVQQRGRYERITFLTDQARDAVHADLATRSARGDVLGPQARLIASRSTRAARLNASLIDAGNTVNVELCRATGRFFRTWGMPGARFANATTEETP